MGLYCRRTLIGSIYERKRTNLRTSLVGRSVFYDDTVLTVAVAEAILRNGPTWRRREHGREITDGDREDTFTTGSHPTLGPTMMGKRIGDAGRPVEFFAFVRGKRFYARRNAHAEGTHNHPEGIKGAQATERAVVMVPHR